MAHVYCNKPIKVSKDGILGFVKNKYLHNIQGHFQTIWIKLCKLNNKWATLAQYFMDFWHKGDAN